MKFGKRHPAEMAKSLPEWEPMFMSYKELKKKLKLIKPHSRGNLSSANMDFTTLLDRELDKINTFYIDKEEDYLIRFRELEIRAGNLNGNEEMLDMQEKILGFHSEMVMLLHYSVINSTGLIKIVKKYRRRTGSSVDEFIPRVLQQPLFSTDLLYNLIRGCETILERLSPLNDP